MKRRNLILAFALLIMAVFGCERRPLELMYSTTVRVIVKCIWNVDVYPEGQKPTGITLYFFKDGEYYNAITTSNVDSCEVRLPEGHYKLYMISQSPEEFWRMEFDKMNSYNEASTHLRESSASWATRSAEDVVVENPEILFAGTAQEFDITTDMVEEYQYYYTNLKRIRSKAEQTKATMELAAEEAYYQERVEYYTIRIPIYPSNIVSQLWVTIYASNADVLKSVRATTSGMARTFELTQNTTANDEAIQIINQWTLNMDDPEARIGHIDGIITTFGLPNGEVPSALRDSTLNVAALLVDNVTVADYIFDVGDKIKIQAPNRGYRNMYRLIFGTKEEPAIELPDVTVDPENTSGMDATVSDWEEGETIIIPI